MSNELQRAIERLKALQDKLKKRGGELWDERGDDRCFLMAQGVEQAITELESIAATPAEPRFRACHACKQILDETPAVCVDGWIFHQRCAPAEPAQSVPTDAAETLKEE